MILCFPIGIFALKYSFKASECMNTSYNITVYRHCILQPCCKETYESRMRGCMHTITNHGFTLTCTHTHTHTHTHAHTHTYDCMHTCTYHTHTHTIACTHAHTIHTHREICTHTNTCTHAHILTVSGTMKGKALRKIVKSIIITTMFAIISILIEWSSIKLWFSATQTESIAQEHKLAYVPFILCFARTNINIQVLYHNNSQLTNYVCLAVYYSSKLKQCSIQIIKWVFQHTEI